DFNNLLGAIMMATDFLLNAHKPTDPSFQDIMQIKQNANRAASLVRQLLAFSRKQTMRPQVIDLGEALSDLTVLLRRLIAENGTLDVPQVRDLWPVKADVGQFEQVIINLAVNARDAMPFGGRLTLRTSNVGAGDRAHRQHKEMPLGEYVLVEVEDTGSGIAPDVIDKIFDPFYTTKDVGKGTGLGLSTVYGIVKQTGGFIYVESAVGKGTIFRIFLPRYIPGADDVEVPQLPETTAPAIAMSAADEIRGAAADLTGRGTILLVEDEEGLRALNARGLQSRGYTVIEAGNGLEALEELERQGGQVDVVVSDVVMPEMDGPTLMKELKKRKPDIKIIFVSGYAEDAFDKSLPDHKQFNFLAKPFTLKQLVKVVKETMAGGKPRAFGGGRRVRRWSPSRCTESGTRTPIPRRAFARYDRGMDDPEQPRQDKYVETARDRRIANALLLFFLIVVVGGGIWLANAMFEQRRLDDCLAPAARNCAPAIDAPAR